MSSNPNVALILSGGGARAAYQAGAMLALSKLLPDPSRNPFPIISGTSAGAVNAVALAAGATDFRRAAGYLAQVWKQVHIENIYDPSLAYFVKTFLHFGVSVLTGGRGWTNPRSFLDNSALRGLLDGVMQFEGIEQSIRAGALRAVALTASCYSSGMSETFFQGDDSIQPWSRYQRVGVREKLGVDHLMATSAIPLIFPSARVGSRYYCDGAVRQMAPLSPALHMGAEKLFIVGVGGRGGAQADRRQGREFTHPSPAQIFGHLLDSVFLDSLSSDMERLLRINHTVSLLQAYPELAEQTPLRRVDAFVLNPSHSLEEIAYRHGNRFPRVMRFVMQGAGATRKRGSVLASYLLFEPEYCRELIALGYKDVLNQKQAIGEFLEL